MIQNERLFFYHKSSWLFVCSSGELQRSVETTIPKNQKFQLFDDAATAERVLIDTNHSYEVMVEQVTSSLDGFHQQEVLETTSSFAQLNMLGSEAAEKVFSIAICEHHPSSVGGNAFLAELRRKGIPSILVVDAKDELQAQTSIQNGLIESYVVKGRQESMADLWKLASEPRSQLFKSCQSRGLGLLYDFSGPLGSDDVWQLIWSRLERGACSEYYCVDLPGGFVVTGADGRRIRILFFGEAEFANAIRIATAFHAPERVLSLLSNKQKLLVTDELDSTTLPEEINWDEFLVSAHALSSFSPYMWGEYDEPPLEIR